MKSLIILILACLTADISGNSRIYGGRDAPYGKYPYQVSIKKDGKHNCGGSIINKHWILTAAHCVKRFDSNSLSVMAGSNLREGGSNQQVYKVQYAVAHKNFDEMLHTQDDIGLIRVAGEIEFDDRVKPISLTKMDVGKVGTLATLSGWGRFEGFDLPERLQEIQLKIYDHDMCSYFYDKPPFIFGKKQLCTVNRIGEGACVGDSGGPLVVDGVQIGLLSYVYTQCAAGKPDVFTRVYSYLNWIEDQIKIYERNLQF